MYFSPNGRQEYAVLETWVAVVTGHEKCLPVCPPSLLAKLRSNPGSKV